MGMIFIEETNKMMSGFREQKKKEDAHSRDRRAVANQKLSKHLCNELPEAGRSSTSTSRFCFGHCSFLGCEGMSSCQILSR